MTSPKIQEMIDLAEEDVSRLRSAKSVKQARAAWAAFLEHSNRAINRIEGFARSTSQSDKYKALLRTIWLDPLAAYMRAARNVHEHGIGETEAADPNPARYRFSNGLVLGMPTAFAERVDTGETVTMVPQNVRIETHGGPSPEVIELPPTIRMVAINSPKGVRFPPQVQPASLDESDVAAAARLYLEWVKARVAEFNTA